MLRPVSTAEQTTTPRLESPLKRIKWDHLDHLAETDPRKAAETWDGIKREALEELRCGHRAAMAMQASQPGPWERAQFLAIRQELGEEWQPRNGIERQLIDAMAISQGGFFEWAEAIARWTSLESVSQHKLAEDGLWQAPRIKDAEAIERAASMMDRFNKIFLRSLRALRDLRRYSRPVIVQNAGQVNVGGQQVNVSS
jgi:hypothetical protein